MREGVQGNNGAHSARSAVLRAALLGNVGRCYGRLRVPSLIIVGPVACRADLTANRSRRLRSGPSIIIGTTPVSGTSSPASYDYRRRMQTAADAAATAASRRVSAPDPAPRACAPRGVPDPRGGAERGPVGAPGLEVHAAVRAAG